MVNSKFLPARRCCLPCEPSMKVSTVQLALLFLLATASFLAVWSFRAVLTLIAEAEARRTAAEEKAATINSPADKGRGGQIRPRE